MSNFYARYVPPVASKPTATTNDAVTNSVKRKHKEPAKSEKPENQTKKRRISEHESVGSKKGHNIDSTSSQEQALKNGQDVIQKYRISEFAKNRGADVELRKSGKGKKRELETPVHAEDEKASEQLNQAVRQARPNPNNEDDHLKQHKSLMKKYDKSKKKTPGDEEATTAAESASDGLATKEVELHGLEPIPQPEQIQTEVQRPTYSTIPAWQAEAVQVDSASFLPLDSFHISSSTTKNLKKAGFDSIFPIQAAVLPLLLPGSSKYNGDLCISAATGSGKTLAYTLPIIEDLKNKPDTKLRGLIVVPTRELVKQVRQVCETCATGSRLKIATAVGTKSLREEQLSLVEEREVYDPEEYRKEQEAEIDWTTFSLEGLILKAQSAKPLPPPDYVARYFSKVDILITTPGRLVEHLQSTEGFNLDDVSWLVVDEADRLLNESYQEWIETITPALESQNATNHRDEILRYARLRVPKRTVQKILLSATMTKDISKLESLGLKRPKLVQLSGTEKTQTAPTTKGNHNEDNLNGGNEDIKPESDGMLRLPLTLTESAVTLKDGYEKPLYLLELLKHIGILAQLEKATANGHLSDTSSDTKSTSDSNSDSDSGSSDHSDNLTSSSGTDSSSGASASSVSASASSSRVLSQPSTLASASATPATTKSRKLSSKTPSSAPRALIFTRSTSAAHRLHRLLTLLDPSLTHTTSTLTRSSPSSTRQTLASFSQATIPSNSSNNNQKQNKKQPPPKPQTRILISTDRAAHGLDIPGLEHVISYDVPNSIESYVHRVGRTARAGKHGCAWTLLEHREGRWFWGHVGGKDLGPGRAEGGVGGRQAGRQKEREIARKNPIARLNLKVDLKGDTQLRERYEAALERLGGEVRGLEGDD